MGWTHSTIDGLGIHPLVTVVQSELIRAVNERREALGLATVDFYYGNGTVEKAYPSVADFDGFPLLGSTEPISSALQSNLGKLQDQIKGLISHFILTSTSDTFYTVSSLETAVGLGAFPATASITNFRNATVWQRILSALNYMLYTKKTSSISAYGAPDYNFGAGEIFAGVGEYPRPWQYRDATEIAWADLGYDSNPASVTALWRMQASYQQTFPVFTARTTVNVWTRPITYGTVDFSAYSGTQTKEIITVLEKCSWSYRTVDSVYPSGVLPYTLTGGVSDSVPVTNDYDSSIQHSVTGVLSLDSSTTLTLDLGTTPIAYPYVFSNQWYEPNLGDTVVQSVSFDSASLWFDLSSVLTDQT